MNDAHQLCDITIFDKIYKIRCPAEEVAHLQQAAQYLSDQMRKLAHNKKTLRPENLSVVAALNIAHELIQTKHQQNQTITAFHSKIQDLQLKIQAVLVEQEEILV